MENKIEFLDKGVTPDIDPHCYNPADIVTSQNRYRSLFIVSQHRITQLLFLIDVATINRGYCFIVLCKNERRPPFPLFFRDKSNYSFTSVRIRLSIENESQVSW